MKQSDDTIEGEIRGFLDQLDEYKSDYLDGRRKWSDRSLENLQGIDPDLRALCDEVLQRSPHDFTIIDGLRTVEEQRLFVQKGVSKTMRSYHLIGRAVDFMPYINGGLVESLPHFRAIAKTFKECAEEMGIRITTGALDWEWDFYHVQLEPYTG